MSAVSDSSEVRYLQEQLTTATSRLTALESGIKALADEHEKRAAELYEDPGGDPAVEAEAWTLNSNAIALRALANECDPSRTQGEKP